MPWYQFACSDLPTPSALDMIEVFMDTMLNADREGLLDRRMGLFKSRESPRGNTTYYLYADSRPFKGFIEKYGAVECDAPSDAQHIGGADLIE